MGFTISTIVYLLRYNRLQIVLVWRKILRLFLKKNQGTKILPMEFTISTILYASIYTDITFDHFDLIDGYKINTELSSVAARDTLKFKFKFKFKFSGVTF